MNMSAFIVRQNALKISSKKKRLIISSFEGGGRRQKTLEFNTYTDDR